MFQDVDTTLKNLLDANPDDPVRSAFKGFATPDRNFQTGVVVETLNLFLHRVQENRELRETVGFAVAGDDPTVRHRPLLRVDCSYLVTAWAPGGGETAVAKEHQLLGSALQWLSRFPTIPAVPAGILAGSLTNPDFPLPYAMSAILDQTRIPVDFWTALGIAPRPSFELIVTIAMDLGTQPIEGPPVTDRDLVVGTKKGDKIDVVWANIHDIAGFVSDAATNPIAGASVFLSGPGVQRTATTLADGSYRFDGVASASYRIRVTAAGFAASDKFVQVPRKDVNFDPDFNVTLN